MSAGARAYRTYMLYSAIEQTLTKLAGPVTLDALIAHPALVDVGANLATVRYAVLALQERGCLTAERNPAGSAADLAFAWVPGMTFDTTVNEKLLRIIRNKPGISRSELLRRAQDAGCQNRTAVHHAVQHICAQGLAHSPEQMRDFPEQRYFMGPYAADLHAEREYLPVARQTDVKRFGVSSREEATLLAGLEIVLQGQEAPLTLTAILNHPVIRGLWVSSDEVTGALAFLQKKGMASAAPLTEDSLECGYCWTKRARSATEFLLREIEREPGIGTFELRERVTKYGIAQTSSGQMLSRLAKLGKIHFPPQTAGWVNRPCFIGPLNPELHQGRQYSPTVTRSKGESIYVLGRKALRFFKQAGEPRSVADLLEYFGENDVEATQTLVQDVLDALTAKGAIEASSSAVDNSRDLQYQLAPLLRSNKSKNQEASHYILTRAARSFFKNAGAARTATDFAARVSSDGLLASLERIEKLLHALSARGWLNVTLPAGEAEWATFQWSGDWPEPAQEMSPEVLMPWLLEEIKSHPGIRKSTLRNKAQLRGYSSIVLNRALAAMLNGSTIFRANKERYPADPGFYPDTGSAANATGQPIKRGARRELVQKALVEIVTEYFKLLPTSRSLSGLKALVDERELSIAPGALTSVVRQLLREGQLTEDFSNEDWNDPYYAWVGPREVAAPHSAVEQAVTWTLETVKRNPGIRQSLLVKLAAEDRVSHVALAQAVAMLRDAGELFTTAEDPRPQDKALFPEPYDVQVHGVLTAKVNGRTKKKRVPRSAPVISADLLNTIPPPASLKFDLAIAPVSYDMEQPLPQEKSSN